ncbi:MAG: DUF6062 family protein [bacterium]
MEGKNLRKKDSKKESFCDNVYFDLLDAMEKKVCPICFLIQKSEYRYMDTLFYELVNDPGVRQKLRKSYGFCTEHAQLAKKVGKPLGIAIIYEDICSTLVEKIEKEEEIPSPDRECPVCKLAEEVEERCLQTFLKNFSCKDFQNRYKLSFGLCMPHFFVVYSRLPAQKEKDNLKQCQLHALRECLPELEEFIRKHDYRFSYEGFGEEATSWNKVVDKVAGSHHK